jgi:hypothetical protein
MAVNRLGDVIDDHCTRCHRVTDHSVVALIGEEVKKVRCRTCNYEHDFRHGKGGQKKKAKLSAYEEVLASITAGKAGDSRANMPEPAKRSKSSAGGRKRSLSRGARLLPKH